VVSFWEADGNGRHRLVFRWDAQNDRFEPTAERHRPAGLERYEAFVRGLVAAGEVEMAAVRRRVAVFYGSTG
jgi:hypothetical protein